MVRSIFSLVFVSAALVLFSCAAQAYKVVPCADGSGCKDCKKIGAINATNWNSATTVKNFDFPAAKPERGGGFEVWWDIPQPDTDCRIFLTEPFLTERGGRNPVLSGNVILTTSHAGCFFAQIGTTVSAAYCCGNEECRTAGALPSQDKTLPPQKRDMPRELENIKENSGALTKRRWGGMPQPVAPPAAQKPLFTCTPATPKGNSYTKSGAQQIDGNTIPCDDGQQCSLTFGIDVSVADGVTAENGTTVTASDGYQYSVTIGSGGLFTATGTAGYSHDFSEAISNSASTSTTNTRSHSYSYTINVIPGANWNLYFTPHYECQLMETMCNGTPVTLEKCSPQLDGDQNPVGDHSVVSVG